MVPWSVTLTKDICGIGSPTAEKKSVAPKSSRLIWARCIALVPLFKPRVLTSKFSIKDTPQKKGSQVVGLGKNLAIRLKGLRMLFLLSSGHHSFPTRNRRWDGWTKTSSTPCVRTRTSRLSWSMLSKIISRQNKTADDSGREQSARPENHQS